MTWTETPVPPNPWVSTAGQPPTMWTPSTPCGTSVFVTTQQKTQTLYYIAGSGQTQFPLSAADMFGNNVLLTDTTALVVFKGGLRLVPDDGTGVGGYTVDMPNNQVNLLWPAGAGEILVADIYDTTAIGTGPQGPQGPPGPVGPPGPNWWLNLPTTLPPTAGVLWNNGGVICVS